jgi:hypothetical protein
MDVTVHVRGGNHLMMMALTGLDGSLAFYKKITVYSVGKSIALVGVYVLHQTNVEAYNILKCQST